MLQPRMKRAVGRCMGEIQVCLAHGNFGRYQMKPEYLVQKKNSVFSQKAQQCTEIACCRVLQMLMLAWVRELGTFVNEKHDVPGRHRNLWNCRMVKAGRTFEESTFVYGFICCFSYSKFLSIHFWPLSNTGRWAKHTHDLFQSNCS